MMNNAQKIWNNITNNPQKRGEKVLREMNPNETEWNSEKKDLVKYIQVLESKLDKHSADERKKKVKINDIEDEIKLIKEAEYKKNILNDERYKGAFDLKILFDIISNKKKKIEICDKDDIKVIDKFKTIVILKNGTLGLKGVSGNIWSEGQTLRNLIWKPEGIRNQVRRKRILIPYDKDFNPALDLENMEMPEMSYDEEEGIYKIRKERYRKVRDMIIERDDENRNLKKEIEMNEQTMADMRNNLRDKERTAKVWQKDAEKSQSDLSVALEKVSKRDMYMSRVDEIAVLSQEQKQLNEKIIEVYETSFEKLLGELEDEKSKTKARRVRDEVHKDLQFAKTLVPKEINTTVISNEEVEEIKPGKSIK